MATVLTQVETAVAGAMAVGMALLQTIVVGRRTPVQVLRRQLLSLDGGRVVPRGVSRGGTASVRPWPLVVDRVDAPPDGHAAATAQLVPPLVRTYTKGLARTQGLDVEKLTQAAMNVGTMGEDCTFAFSGQGLSLPSSGGHDICSSSASIQSGNPKAWTVRDEALSRIGPLSPTLELTPSMADGTMEVEEGEIVEPATVTRGPTTTPPAAPDSPGGTPVGAAASPLDGSLAAASIASGSTDIQCGLAAFRERCRAKKAALLPRPLPRKTRKKRPLPSVVRRSARVAGRFAPRKSIKAQQHTLMIQLGIMWEGEVIGDEALQAYLRYFDEQPMTTDHLAACLALFGWHPDVLLVVDDDLVGDTGWWLTGVYGPQPDSYKCLFLQEIKDIWGLHPGLWAIAGDFNLVVDADDKSNMNLNRRMMGKFRRVLTDLELKELYLNGRRFTWSNERERATLDRVFSMVDWEVLFPSFLSGMSSSTSDHWPLLLSLATEPRACRGFRFEAFWPKVDGFLETVENAWLTGPVVANPFKRLAGKLAATAKSLSSWNDRFIGNNKKQILLANELIYNRRGLRQSDPLSPLLFDTVMDVLHLMSERAVNVGLLTELSTSGFRHLTSMYADDVVNFVRPTEVDLRTCTQTVEDFGVALGLCTNLAKCSLHPIRCSQEHVALASSILGCEVASFPFKYLGLPLGLRKVTVAQLQPIVDSAASRLPPWCAKLLNRGVRTILVQSTLSAIPVHTMMSLDIPPKVVEVLRKIFRAFLWKGRQEVKGGHCLVAWDKVTSPKDLGGLGIPNLRLLNLALRCRWAWLQKVDTSKAWAEFNIQLPSLCTAIFDATTCYVLGHGE
ncbi:hypothetical protein QYE76_052002 [Lolium multiflorum]|uniref:Reverse transcriptase domain-containing protein n=1 Tax=Lolium multiflorum TaxID=4521 RepID=A0AAD8SUQ8_LOLMU|nr:hypothetical protein QYE76_052002 [Lolium multiflorum]